MKFFVNSFAIFLLSFVAICGAAWAACTDPSAEASKLAFNSELAILQYCNGTDWVGFSKAGAGWKQISASKDWSSPYACGITNDGKGWCWGTDDYGRLGNGAGTTAMQTTPSLIEGGYTWKQISTGHDHACGIRSDDVAMCWGSGSSGQLGNATWGPDQAAPVVVSGGYSWSKISAGGTSCGIRTDGVAMCWGSDFNGRLGNGAGGDANVPGVVSGGYSWTDISSGLDHTCGVIASGAGYCWGMASVGRLGNGTTTPNMQTPSLVAGGHTWQSISASGYQTTCGMTTSGQGYCWGEANGGKLGNGTTSPNMSSPSLVLGGHTWQAVGSGTNAGCGLTTTNALYCWGDNSWESTGTGASRTTPFLVSGGHLWSSTSVGGSIGCGIRTDGNAMCWGRSDTGALGNDITSPDTSAVPVLVGKAVKDCTLGTWTARAAAEANSWYSVAYGNGLFVAVSIDGTNRVMTSPDGITWTPRTAAQANQWQSVTYGNGVFVAVASSGTNRVMTSPDGITWTARTAAQANSWETVTYGNGLFVAVASTGTSRVMTSPDGITWTARTAAQANSWYAVTYGNGVFVAVAISGTNRVMTSPDGITWTARTAAQANNWWDVTYGNGLFVALAGNGTNRVMTSPDGITWTARTAAQQNIWNSVVYANGQFVAVSEDGTNRVMTSADGISWIGHTAAGSGGWESVTYGGGQLVAVAYNDTNRVMTAKCVSGCTTVTAGNRPPGAIFYNLDHRVLQWCDGSMWHAMGPPNPPGPNDGCDTITAGTRPPGNIFFNADYCILQYCDGDNWRGIGTPTLAPAIQMRGSGRRRPSRNRSSGVVLHTATEYS